MGSPSIISGRDPTIILYAYINRHTKPPNGRKRTHDGLLCEMISQERCTGSARGGSEAHLFGRTDRSLKRKVALIWPGHKLEAEKRVRVGGNQKDPQGKQLGAISRLTEIMIYLMYVLSTRP